MSPAGDYLPNVSAPTAYLIPQIEAFYPLEAAEFRSLFQAPTSRASSDRQLGLETMTDDEISRLARALREAFVYAPNRVPELWAAIEEQGRRVREMGL